MTAENLVFVVLQILTRQEDGLPVVLRSDELRWGDRWFPLEGGVPLGAGSSYLLRRVGPEHISIEQLAETWSPFLADEKPRSSQELLAAVRRPEARAAEEDEIPRRWRAAVEPLLRETLREVPAVLKAERVGSETQREKPVG